MSENLATNDLVGTEWLAERLGDSLLRVVESTWFLPNIDRSGRAEFETDHIPGARYWDIDEIADEEDPRPHMLPDAEAFAGHMARLGIGAASHVVVYDRVGMMTVGRVWWMLRFYGHDRVSILDGGYPAWLAEDRPVEAGPGVESAPPSAFVPRPRPELVRSLDQIRALSGGEDSQLLDARSAARFNAEEPEPRPECRSGHIPGSMNLPYTGLVDPATGRFLAPAALRQLFEEAGLDFDRSVTTSCGSGVTACLLAFGLHLLGRDRVAVYDGSWSEWGARSDTPIEPES